MARRFTASSSERIAIAPGAISGMTGSNCTVVALIRLASDSQDGAILRAKDASNSLVFGLRLTTSGSGGALPQSLNYGRGASGTVATSVNVTAADGWVLVGATVGASGTGASLFRCRLSDGDLWFTVPGPNQADGTGPVSYVVFGDDTGTAGRFFNGDIAAAAIFSRSFSQDEVKSLAASLSVWKSWRPAGLWLFDQQLTSQRVLDWSGGGANQTSITGTSVSTGSVPIFGYGHPILQAARATAGGDGGAGAAAVGLPPLSAAGSGAAAAAGASATSLPPLTAAGAGTAHAAGTAPAVLPHLTGTAAGATSATGASAAALPSLAAAATGIASDAGTAAPAFPPLQVAAAGTVASVTSGAIAATLPALTGAAAGTARATGGAALAAPPLTAQAVGVVSASGSAAAVLPALSAAATATARAEGTASAAPPALTAAAAGTVTNTGTGTAPLPAFTAQGGGGAGLLGDAAIALPALTSAGVGTATTGGSTAVALPALVAAANGDVSGTAQGALLLPTFTAVGSDAPVYIRRPGILTAGAIRSRLTTGSTRGPR